MHQKSQPMVALHPWKWPSRPWTRLHIDLAGPFEGRMFLAVVDSHFKWLDVISVLNANLAITTRELRKLFTTHGIPEIVVLASGTAFTGKEFYEFMARNDIWYLRTAPYHTATNGLVEHAIQTFKTATRKPSNGSIDSKLVRFLFHYT